MQQFGRQMLVKPQESSLSSPPPPPLILLLLLLLLAVRQRLASTALLCCLLLRHPSIPRPALGRAGGGEGGGESSIFRGFDGFPRRRRNSASFDVEAMIRACSFDVELKPDFELKICSHLVPSVCLSSSSHGERHRGAARGDKGRGGAQGGRDTK